MADVGFWETIVVSVLASGISSSALAAVVAARNERRRQDKRLQLEKLERAITLALKDFEEANDFIKDFSSDKFIYKEKRSVNPLELHMAIVICIPYLDKSIGEYREARDLLSYYLEKFNSSKGEDKIVLRPTIASHFVKFSKTYVPIWDGLLSEYRRILGIRKPSILQRLAERYSALTRKVYWNDKNTNSVRNSTDGV
jgi:hypothetical protein